MPLEQLFLPAGSGIGFTEQLPPCDGAAFQAIAAGFQTAFALESSAYSTIEHDRSVALEAALTTSDAWVGCLNMAETQLANGTTVNITHLASTACYAAPGSANYDSDPCCNPGYGRRLARFVLTASGADTAGATGLRCLSAVCSCPCAACLALSSSRPRLPCP
jgi:hypothetical protein